MVLADMTTKQKQCNNQKRQIKHHNLKFLFILVITNSGQITDIRKLTRQAQQVGMTDQWNLPNLNNREKKGIEPQ